MSALGSSVINKSGKKFAPKTPARRPAAPASTHTSARPSAERQAQSQTPQPQSSTQRVAASPTPSTFLPTPSSTQQPATSPQVLASVQIATTPIPLLSRGTAALARSPPRSLVPQKRFSEPRQSPRQVTPVNQAKQISRASVIVGPSPIPKEPDRSSPSFNPTSSNTHSIQEKRSITITNLQSTSTAVIDGSEAFNNQAAKDDIQAPAAKRRRTVKKSTTQASHANADANIPLPTTETIETVVEGSSIGEVQAAPRQPSKAKRARSSGQARGRQEIEYAAAALVDAATGTLSATIMKSRNPAKGKIVDRNQLNLSKSPIDPASMLSGAATQDQAPLKAKGTHGKRKGRRSLQDAAAEIVENAVVGSSKDPTKCARKSKRAATPDGADAIVISTSEVKMAELCKDARTGRKSEREKELVELERAEFVRKKQRQLQEVMGQVDPEGQASPAEAAEARLDRLERQGREECVAQNVPNTIIVDGQIRIDEDSLQIDRHAAAAIERAAEQLEAVDESEMTRKVNSASWMKRDKSGGWNALLTERFYDGLRMFGTDFEMISKMFPGRTRHKIKLKFVKEEKMNYERIRATLLGQPVLVDLPEYEKMAGTEFDDPRDLEKDIEEDRKRLEEETAAEKQALDDANKEREEAIAAERAAAIASEDSSSKENRGRKGKRKKGERRKTDESQSKVKQAKKSRAAGDDSVVRELGESLGPNDKQ